MYSTERIKTYLTRGLHRIFKGTMDITSNYHAGNKASVLAYELTPEKIRGQHRYKIIEKINEVGDATCSELEILLNLTHQTASARISELKRDEIIKETGKKRLTQSGRPAHVYKLNEEKYGLG